MVVFRELSVEIDENMAKTNENDQKGRCLCGFLSSNNPVFEYFEHRFYLRN